MAVGPQRSGGAPWPPPARSAVGSQRPRVAPDPPPVRLVVGSCCACLVVGVESEVAEAEDFANVVVVDLGVTGEISDGPGDQQPVIKTANKKTEPINNHPEQASGGDGRLAGRLEVGDGQ